MSLSVMGCIVRASLVMAASLLLGGCAGNEAMQWRPPPPPEPKDRTFCDDWGCRAVTKKQLDRIIRDIERQMNMGRP
jgi:hypothetical protein